jgi:poly(3-hydroxybutyrate) depolymerase
MSNFMGLAGIVWEVGPKSEGTGSLIFYWHGTGSSDTEYVVNVPFLAELKSMGGILVSPQSGTGTGGDCSGTGTFAMDDFKVADQIAACAVRDWGTDPHRIWATGCSAGGLQAGCMALMRSSYMAGAVPNSGGEYLPIGQEDMSHAPSMMTVHGMAGQDVVIIDFSQSSKMIDDQVKAAGGFAIDCDHGGGHCAIPMLPADVANAGWQFMKDHPFGVSTEPYAGGLPASFPTYCKIW